MTAILIYLGMPPVVGFATEVALVTVIVAVTYRAGRAAGEATGFRAGIYHRERLERCDDRLHALEVDDL